MADEDVGCLFAGERLDVVRIHVAVAVEVEPEAFHGVDGDAELCCAARIVRVVDIAALAPDDFVGDLSKLSSWCCSGRVFWAHYGGFGCLFSADHGPLKIPRAIGHNGAHERTPTTKVSLSDAGATATLSDPGGTASLSDPGGTASLSDPGGTASLSDPGGTASLSALDGWIDICRTGTWHSLDGKVTLTECGSGRTGGRLCPVRSGPCGHRPSDDGCARTGLGRCAAARGRSPPGAAGAAG